MEIKCKLLSPLALLPTKATSGSAGYDLFSIGTYTIPPGSRQLIATGIALQFPSFLYGRIAPRSGLSFRHSLDIGAGVIDSDFTGEIKVLLINNGREVYKVDIGDKVAQIIFEIFYSPKIVPSTSIEETERSDHGFGSSGYR